MEYLAFVDEIGRTLDGKYIYRMDFTVDTETVWGDFFNVAPAAIIPDLQPDKNTLSHCGNVIFPRQMITAKKNYCFSMQDCIDGIIPLFFSEADDEQIEYEGKPIFFNFGEEYDSVCKKLSAVGIEIYDFKEVERGDESAIDAFIDSIPDNNDEDDEF